MVDEESVIHQTAAEGRSTGNSHEETLAAVLHHWIRHYGRPLLARSDPESNYRANILQDWTAAHSIQWDLSHRRRTGKVKATVDLFKAATKMAYCDASCSIPEPPRLTTRCGSSPDAVILGRAVRPLDSALEGSLVHIEQETIRGRADEAPPMSLPHR